MTKVLITGCAGLLGSHFSRYLLDEGYEVYGIDDLSGGYQEYIDPRVKFYNFNLIESQTLGLLFQEVQPDYVYHFAAYAAEGLSPFIRRFNYTNNLICSVNVINNCIKYDAKIIFTSSMAVYGNNLVPYTEDMTPNPVDPYGIAKYAVEMDLKQACEQFGLRYTIVRPHNVIGIYQNIWDKYRNVIGIWINRVLKGESIRIFGDGEQKRAFSDIKFYMKPFEQLMTECDGQTINLGSDKEYTLNQVALALQELTGAEIEHVEERREVKIAYCNHDKAKFLLKFDDQTNLKETIKEMYEWAKTQPDRETKQMDYELNKGMYSFWK